MELTEKIETINDLLETHFGIDTISGIPIWRVVWSEDQFEKRLVDTTPSGVLLLKPEVREVPKYRQWVQEKYVLERLVLVPDVDKETLPSQKVSYEPMWVFQDNKGNPLPPRFEYCQLIVDTVYAALGKSSLAKYIHPGADEVEPEVAIAKQKARIDNVCQELFGDESGLDGSLVHGEGIVVPNMPNAESANNKSLPKVKES